MISTKRLIKTFLSKPFDFKIAIIILTVFTLAALCAGLYSRNGIDTDIENILQSPSLQHLFGTDDLGRDYFARALHGARASLSVGFLSVILSTAIGTAIGIISGYFGGKTDMIIMRTVDILMSIPSFFLILILNAYLKPGIQNIIVIIGLFNWMGIARLIRAETLSVKERDYVIYARMIGVADKKIMAVHILKNILETIIVAASINVARAILTESTLSFLGLGVRPPYSSWGSMLKDAQAYLREAPYLAFIPGVLILLTVLAFNLIGDTIRDKRNNG